MMILIEGERYIHASGDRFLRPLRHWHDALPLPVGLE